MICIQRSSEPTKLDAKELSDKDISPRNLRSANALLTDSEISGQLESDSGTLADRQQKGYRPGEIASNLTRVIPKTHRTKFQILADCSFQIWGKASQYSPCITEREDMSYSLPGGEGE